MTRQQLQTDTELKLCLAGIKVLTLEQTRKTPGGLFLYVMADVDKTEFRVYPFTIIVQIWQSTVLVRNPKIITSAPIWSVRVTGITGADKVVKVRDIARDYADKFINAYLSVTPKK